MVITLAYDVQSMEFDREGQRQCPGIGGLVGKIVLIGNYSRLCVSSTECQCRGLVESLASVVAQGLNGQEISGLTGECVKD
jgi:hypothetical protein